MAMTFFSIEESPIHKNMYIILPTSYFYSFISSTKGSYHVYQARAFGLSYANYLRMLRDEHKAVIYGKNQLYPAAFFKTKEDGAKILAELNRRFTKLVLRY